MKYIIKRFSKIDTREDASKELIKKAKKSGVIQKVGDSWRIVSIKKGKLWNAHYTSEEKAKAALRGYQATKHFSKTYPYTKISKHDNKRGLYKTSNGDGYLDEIGKRRVDTTVIKENPDITEKEVGDILLEKSLECNSQSATQDINRGISTFYKIKNK